MLRGVSQADVRLGGLRANTVGVKEPVRGKVQDLRRADLLETSLERLVAQPRLDAEKRSYPLAFVARVVQPFEMRGVRVRSAPGDGVLRQIEIRIRDHDGRVGRAALPSEPQQVASAREVADFEEIQYEALAIEGKN